MSEGSVFELWIVAMYVPVGSVNDDGVASENVTPSYIMSSRSAVLSENVIVQDSTF